MSETLTETVEMLDPARHGDTKCVPISAFLGVRETEKRLRQELRDAEVRITALEAELDQHDGHTILALPHDVAAAVISGGKVPALTFFRLSEVAREELLK